ncbi:PLP-dependent transferase, partial [Thozetella sp. PMI_491]
MGRTFFWNTSSWGDNGLTETAIVGHNLSKRGACGFLHRDVWGPRENSMGNSWSPSNHGGTVILRLAENSLMHNEIAAYVKSQITVHATSHLTYSTGPRGSRRLRRAAAAFWTREFRPHTNITADNILITPGLASALDAMAWAICDEGDGILIPLPLYNGFQVDITSRSNVQVIGISYEEIEGYSDMDDIFRPDVNRKAVEASLRNAEDRGIKIRALLISKLPPETLIEFATICGQRGLHFISDEIYAKSVFSNPTIPDAAKFTSALTLDLRGIIDPSYVHLLYGASKDFCANGMRLGFVCTQNKGVMGALSSISIFSWSPHLLQDTWAAMLEDEQWLRDFMLKKIELTQEHYGIATSFFRRHSIHYYEMNAGLFIWVDLRYLILPQSSPEPRDYSVLKRPSPDDNVYEKREATIANICIRNGVMIAPGHAYMSEEYGWFRLTFTVGREALHEGLNRFLRSLKEVELQSQ